MNLIIPMEPILREEIFDSSDFTYQLKWDGVRMLTYVSGGKVELFNKRLHNRSDQYPELQLFSSLFKKNKVILDGEIIAFKDSKPNFPAVMRRDNARNKQRIQLLMQEVPINYIVFDLLWYEDEDLRVLSWEQRQQRLKELLKPQAMIHIIEDFPSGSSLFNAVKKAELEGVVAKRKASRYQDGKKHRDWFKIKYRRRQACVVGGYTLRNDVANSLLLGVYHDGLLRYVGRAGSGLKVSEWQELTTGLKLLQTNVAPFASFPGRLKETVFWLEPRLVIDVEFAEWTDDMHLRSPVIKDFLKIAPEECQV